MLINLNLYLTYKGEGENTVEVECVCVYKSRQRTTWGGVGKTELYAKGVGYVGGRGGSRDLKYSTHDGVEILTSERREATK